jgi:diguanylate cyclase (GGDEF)-like protein
MTLDMPTISLVSIAATTIIGLVLLFVWWRERTSALIGWWGLAQIVMASGIAMAATASATNRPPLSVFGQALMVLSAAMLWMAVREFEGRKLDRLLVAVWPCFIIVAAATGLTATFDQRLILSCTLMATLLLMTAAEFAYQEGERLVSRWPAIVLLIVTGASFLTWMPLTLIMPIREVGLVYASGWMPAVILVALLGRIALALVVLAIVKERQEVQQRMFALTDALTGLPNRRALFEAADELAAQGKYLRGHPISVMVLDLDHFKMINDTYGHRLGDRVLQLFANTMADELDAGTIMGRLGGEEFAAILPGADLSTAAAKAERLRAAFADMAAVIDGLAVAGTVSIGVAAHDDIDCDIGGLFHRADGALYTAKKTGRNRVQAIGPLEPMEFEDTGIDAHMVPPRWFTELGQRTVLLPKERATRRYRGSADAA